MLFKDVDMLFKDLEVGDVFKLKNPRLTEEFIKISDEYDDRTDITKWDLPYIKPNMFILDRRNYGAVVPQAKVIFVKRRSDKEELEVI